MLVERAVSQSGGLLAAYQDGVQLRASTKGIVLDSGHSLGQLYFLQCGAAVEGLAADGLDGRGQRDVAQLGAAVEPRLAHIVKPYTLKPPEVSVAVDVVLLGGELTVEPRESGSGNTCIVDVIVPLGGVGAGVGGVVVGHFLQGITYAHRHTVIVDLDDAGHEAVLVLGPRRVGLEPGHLLRHHLQACRCSVEHATADADHLRRHGGHLVDAVGFHIEQVEVGQVRAVHESRVADVYLQFGIAVAKGTGTIQVNKRYRTQVLVTLECPRNHLVELVVVVGTYVVTQFHGTLMTLDEVVVRTYHDGVLYQVTAHLVLLLDGVQLVGVCVLGTVLFVLGSRGSTLVLEISCQRFPRGVIEEVLLARGVDDDMELQRVETGKDAVAAQYEILRAQGAGAVFVGLKQGAELRQRRAAHEGRVGDGEQHGHARIARLSGDLMELHGLQLGLVTEGSAVEGHGAVRRVHIVVIVEACIDDGIRHIVTYTLDISMVHEVLLRRGDDIATSHKAHLMDIGEDVLAHTLVHQVGIVCATAAPVVDREQRCRTC